MRYYYYGDKRSPTEKTAGSGRAGAVRTGSGRRMPDRDQDLVIEEDTVYEIDRDCIQCQRKRGNRESR